MPAVRVTAPVDVTEASIQATVIRCGCGDPLRIHAKDASGNIGPCPTPRAVEDRGIVSYYHRNPLRRWLWEMRRAWREGRGQ